LPAIRADLVPEGSLPRERVQAKHAALPVEMATVPSSAIGGLLPRQLKTRPFTVRVPLADADDTLVIERPGIRPRRSALFCVRAAREYARGHSQKG
jgi:hypothetical protein